MKPFFKQRRWLKRVFLGHPSGYVPGPSWNNTDRYLRALAVVAGLLGVIVGFQFLTFMLLLTNLG